jgi:hypothetical protein
METIELMSSLILAFILFFIVGVSLSIVLFKTIFKPLTEEELERWRQHDAMMSIPSFKASRPLRKQLIRETRLQLG